MMLTTSVPARKVPGERSVNLGFEDVIAGEDRWQEIGRHLAACGANAVSLAVGRVDWTAFEWERYPAAASSAVREADGRDLLAGALEALDAHLPPDRGVTLTIDAFAPRLLAEDPRLAGRSPDGARSEYYAGVSALETGIVGERIVRLAGDLAARYGPDRIALTELMFDDATFGADDLPSYRRHEGAADWPRLPGGAIDTRHPSLGRWRSRVLTSLLSRVVDAVAGTGCRVEMDVRAPWDDPESDRALSGHDYAMLLTQADRLAVWAYTGLGDGSPQRAAAITASLARRFPGRFVMSTGLWADAGVLSAAELETALRAVADAGADAVSTTPTSLLQAEHWGALERAWRA
jgi:hypothetical protein